VAAINKLLAKGEDFENICFGDELKDFGFEPVAALLPWWYRHW